MYYALDFNKASEISKVIAQKKGINIKKIPDWTYSIYHMSDWFGAEQRDMEIRKEDKYLHIIKFFACLATINSEVWTYRYDPLEYLGLVGDSIFT